jgi:hypothetical protein
MLLNAAKGKPDEATVYRNVTLRPGLFAVIPGTYRLAAGLQLLDGSRESFSKVHYVCSGGQNCPNILDTPDV